MVSGRTSPLTSPFESYLYNFLVAKRFVVALASSSYRAAGGSYGNGDVLELGESLSASRDSLSSLEVAISRSSDFFFAGTDKLLGLEVANPRGVLDSPGAFRQRAAGRGLASLGSSLVSSLSIPSDARLRAQLPPQRGPCSVRLAVPRSTAVPVG